MSFTAITLTGHFVVGGTNATGEVEIEPTAEMVLSSSNEIAARKVYRYVLASGAFTATLYATDDVGVAPTGVLYRVTTKIDGAQPRTFHIDLPKATPSVDLADITPTQLQPARYQYLTAADVAAYALDADLDAHTTSTSAHGISAFGATLVDDADNTAARSTLGLGSMATQAASAVAITGGTVAGITDLAVADGGTGSSTASGARTNLGLGTAATKDTGYSAGSLPLVSSGTPDGTKFLRDDGAWTIPGGGGGGGASDLDDLTDVTVTTPAASDTLVYDGAGWANRALAAEEVPFDASLGYPAFSGSHDVQAALNGIGSAFDTHVTGADLLHHATDVTVDTSFWTVVSANYVQDALDAVDTELGNLAATKQPLDTDLTAIAALTSAANKGLQSTGAGTWALYDLTAAGKALLDDADAAAQRTTLGLGTMATATATDYVAKSLYDANTILIATANDTPLALTVGASTIVGRKASGDIVALTAAELRAIIGVPVIFGQDEGPALTHTSLASQTRIIDAAWTVAANAFLAGDELEIDAWGTYTNNSGGNQTPTFQITYGTTSFTVATPALATNATQRMWHLQASCRFESTSDQNWAAQLDVTGITQSGISVATTAEDATTSKALDLSFASSNTATQAFQLTHVTVKKRAFS